MRSLKFRAWDKKRKRMFAVTTLNASGAVSVFIDDDGLYLLPAEQIELMQYTELKDKNGKEIYDGDIVEEDIDFNSKMTDGTFRYRVYWDEYLLCWALDPIGKESIHDELWQTNLSRRIIGNIYENPELLEEKK